MIYKLVVHLSLCSLAGLNLRQDLRNQKCFETYNLLKFPITIESLSGLLALMGNSDNISHAI